MDMKKNMGKTDRIIRLILAAMVVVLFFTNVISGMLGIILLVGAGALVLTFFVSFCGLYVPFGINTCKMKESQMDLPKQK
jgi:hypothetical protein